MEESIFSKEEEAKQLVNEVRLLQPHTHILPSEQAPKK
jgi:hypothetical protein